MKAIEANTNTTKPAGVAVITQNNSILKQLEKKLLDEMAKLDPLKINGTTLRTVKIVPTLQILGKNKSNIFNVECVNKANALVDKWKIVVRSMEKEMANCKGGKVAAIPKTKEEIAKPEHLSNALWRKLVANYNVSQLFAIKYVADKFDSQQDTRIALIQGK